MTSLMEKEALQAPLIIEKQLKENKATLDQIARILQKKEINFIQTVARGSSNNAALYAKYLFEDNLNIVTCHADLCMRTVYKANLNLKNSLILAISQSGESPDLIEYLSYAKKNKAFTLAIVNTPNSPLAKVADIVILIHAEKEKAVAATKTFLATLSALAQFVGYLKKDKSLLNLIDKLPERLHECLNIESEAFIREFSKIDNLFVIARGYLLPIAKEIALKFKETCSIHAEAYSSAEVLHGPMALVDKNFHGLFLFQKDASREFTLDVYQKFTKLKAKVFSFLPSDLLIRTNTDKFLITPKSLHPTCDPLIQIQTFYPLCAKLSLKRKKNPDNPQNISKITKTT